MADNDKTSQTEYTHWTRKYIKLQVLIWDVYIRETRKNVLMI